MRRFADVLTTCITSLDKMKKIVGGTSDSAFTSRDPAKSHTNRYGFFALPRI